MEAQQPAQSQAEKDFADLLASLMDCVEKYQEGEAGEGNYLTAMNCLRDIHKFKDRLKGNVVYHHYEHIARQPAPPPQRATARRKKLTDDQKRQAGYKTCPTCGCLFADNSKLKRHQDTTEKCRHIRMEKEVALNTNRVFRDKTYRPMEQGEFIAPPREFILPREHILKDHPYRATFIQNFLLCFGHREVYTRQLQANGEAPFPMTSPVCFLREGFDPNEDHPKTATYYIMFCPSASFLRRDPANAIVSLSNFLTPPGYAYDILAVQGEYLTITTKQYDRIHKKRLVVKFQEIREWNFAPSGDYPLASMLCGWIRTPNEGISFPIAKRNLLDADYQAIPQER